MMRPICLLCMILVLSEGFQIFPPACFGQDRFCSGGNCACVPKMNNGPSDPGMWATAFANRNTPPSIYESTTPPFDFERAKVNPYRYPF